MDQTNTLPAPAAAEPSHDQIQALLDHIKFSQEKEKFLLSLPRIADNIRTVLYGGDDSLVRLGQLSFFLIIFLLAWLLTPKTVSWLRGLQRSFEVS